MTTETESPVTSTESITVAMEDGRSVTFGKRQKIAKDHGTDDDGNVWCRIDFASGQVVQLVVPPTSTVGLKACGHGLSQKLGDVAANCDNVADAYEGIVEAAKRLQNNEWNAARTGDGSGSAKGSSELVRALVTVLNTPIDKVREMMAAIKPADKTALRNLPEVKAEIERIKAEAGPSAAEKKKAEEAAALLASLRAGEVPVAPPTESAPA